MHSRINFVYKWRKITAFSHNLQKHCFLTHSSQIMIKIPVGNGETISYKQNLNTKYVLSETLALDGAELIPIDCGGRLISPTTTVNELGKQLLKAAGEGNTEETKALLNRGALFTADWLGTSPLHLAARNNHLETCEILLKAGISKDARTKVDKTSLHMAAYEGHISIVEILLEYGADSDCRDLLGMTPLHWAAQNGHAEIVKILVKHFAQTDALNKFDISPSDIAAQINRQDIVDLLTMITNESSSATQHLTLELLDDSDDSSRQTSEQINGSTPNSPVPLETILLEDTDNSLDAETLNLENPEPNSDFTLEETNEGLKNNFAASIKLLQEHGITMLPNDDNNILTTVMETGHSVVLTDVGKQMLNSLKESEQNFDKTNKKIITVTPEEFLTMAANCTTNGGSNILRQVNGRLVQKNMKRIVMKKNKVVPVSSAINNMYKYKKTVSPADMEVIMNQLIEAHKTIEEYKIRLFKKEQEAEKYKQQLKLLMQDS